MPGFLNEIHDEAEEIDRSFYEEAMDSFWREYTDEDLEEMLRSENSSQARELNAQNGWDR